MNVTPSNVRVTILDQSLAIKVLQTFTRIRSSGGAVYPSVWPSGCPSIVLQQCNESRVRYTEYFFRTAQKAFHCKKIVDFLYQLICQKYLIKVQSHSKVSASPLQSMTSVFT